MASGLHQRALPPGPRARPSGDGRRWRRPPGAASVLTGSGGAGPGLGMARGPLLVGLLLLLCSEVLWATSSPKEDEVKDGVHCPFGQYVNGSCKMDPNGTYIDQPNNKRENKSKSYDQKCGRNEHWDPDSQRCVCDVGYIKGGNCPEFCERLARCGIHKSPGPGTMIPDSLDSGTREPHESMTGQHSEATPTSSTPTSSTPTSSTLTSSPPPTRATGSTGSVLPNRLIICICIVLALLVILSVVIYICCKCQEKLCVWGAPCISYFQRICYFRDRTQPQGQVHAVSGPDPRNGFEMPVVAVNGQYNPKETHSLLPGGNSDSALDSAISVVPEVMPQSGSPNTPPPAQVTLEQEPGCTSVASSP